jgi:hypothetical protein
MMSWKRDAYNQGAAVYGLPLVGGPLPLVGQDLNGTIFWETPDNYFHIVGDLDADLFSVYERIQTKLSGVRPVRVRKFMTREEVQKTLNVILYPPGSVPSTEPIGRDPVKDEFDARQGDDYAPGGNGD